MPWLHVDQRGVRDQCEAILARAAAADDPGHQARGEATQQALIEVLRRVRLVPGARPNFTAWLLAQVDDPAKQRRTIQRAGPAEAGRAAGRGKRQAADFRMILSK